MQVDALLEPHVYSICSIKFIASTVCILCPCQKAVLKPLGFPAKSTLISGPKCCNEKSYINIGPFRSGARSGAYGVDNNLALALLECGVESG